MTLAALMRCAWLPPGQRPTPPPFKALLPSGTGYIAVTGETVYYGQPPYFRDEPPIFEPPAPIVFQPIPPGRDKRHWHCCRACGKTGKMTRHHPIPREFKPQGKNKGVILLCHTCHMGLHKHASNKTLLGLNEEAQIFLIRKIRGIEESPRT